MSNYVYAPSPSYNPSYQNLQYSPVNANSFTPIQPVNVTINSPTELYNSMPSPQVASNMTSPRSAYSSTNYTRSSPSFPQGMLATTSSPKSTTQAVFSKPTNMSNLQGKSPIYDRTMSMVSKTPLPGTNIAHPVKSSFNPDSKRISPLTTSSFPSMSSPSQCPQMKTSPSYSSRGTNQTIYASNSREMHPTTANMMSTTQQTLIVNLGQSQTSSYNQSPFASPQKVPTTNVSTTFNDCSNMVPGDQKQLGRILINQENVSLPFEPTRGTSNNILSSKEVPLISSSNNLKVSSAVQSEIPVLVEAVKSCVDTLMSNNTKFDCKKDRFGNDNSFNNLTVLSEKSSAVNFTHEVFEDMNESSTQCLGIIPVISNVTVSSVSDMVKIVSSSSCLQNVANSSSWLDMFWMLFKTAVRISELCEK